MHKTTYTGPYLKRPLVNLFVISFIFLFFVCELSAQTPVDDQPTVTATEIITPFDTIPRFCSQPTAVAQTNGVWSDPSIWSTNSVPGSGARVSIPQNIQVTYDANSSEGIDCIEIGAQGELNWTIDQGTLLHVTVLQVLPNGTLTIGSDQNPINNQAEVVIQDKPLDVNGRDPKQYGNGIHGFGTVQVNGAPMDRTFIRFASEALAGQTTLELEQSPVGWLPGDRLIIPDTRQIPFRKNKKYISQAEEPTILAINDSTVTLSAPLQFDHRGPRDANGNTGPIELGMLPHVGNLSRNVIIRSTRISETSKSSYCSGPQNSLDASECVTRGHILLMERAGVDIRYAGFENLGRTTIGSLNNTSIDTSGNVTAIGLNQIGRYSIHLHHVMGPVNATNTGDQFTLVGNVIEGMLKWGLAVHDSHYGLVKDNIAYDGQGSAITTEDGNESFNVFERNFVVHTKAGDQEQVLESPKRGGVFSGRKLFGTTRDGFWFSGMNNFLRDNVVANAPDFAYNYNGYYLTQKQPIPNFRGANMETDSTIQIALPVLESARNEAYGATGQGLWATWSRGCCGVSPYKGISLFKDYRIWHVNHSGAEFYHENRNTLDGFILRNNPAVSAQSEGGSLRFNRGLDFANRSYENGQTIFRNIDMQGFNVGIQMPLRPEDGTDEPNITLLENSFLKNYENIRVGLPNIDSKEAIIRNVKTEPLNIQGVNGQPSQPTAIRMRYSLSRFTNLVNRSSRTFVFDFNEIPGNDFEIFFEEQAPDFLIPPEPSFNGRLKGCPEAGLTNQQCFAKFGVAVAGAIAPCIEQDGEANCASARARATALGIQGLVFPISDTFNILPVAVITNISAVLPPGDAPFTQDFTGANSTDADGNIVSYAWDFGDGSNASGVQTTHTYQNAGTFVVQLTVTDDDGAVDTATTTLVVTSVFDPKPPRTTAGLVALYDFNEGTGSTVLDQSGVSPVMNLDIQNQATTTSWLPEALSIDSETVLQPASTPIEFVDAFKATNEMTIEAWVKPSNASQTGPARIVTFSKDGGNRNFTLGHDGDDYQLRLRQSGSSSNGSPYLSTPNSTTTTNLTHIVVTRATNGDRTFYLDGNQVSSSNVPGDFSNWFTSGHTFALANEIGGVGERHWEGEFHLVALYNTALTPTEVTSNFFAGADAGTTATPPNSRNDFDGDGDSDLLVVNDSGQVAVVLLENSVIQTFNLSVVTANPTQGWTIHATADFNGDRKKDILLYNSITGEYRVVLMDGTTVISDTVVLTLDPVLGLAPRGLGDFNGDGFAEIVVYQPASGFTALIYLSGGGFASFEIVTQIDEANNVTLKDTGDFNQDGKTDLLTFNTVTGDTAVIEMDGSTPLATTSIFTLAPATGLTVEDNGEFDGDGKTGVVVLHTSGALGVFTLNGVAYQSFYVAGNLPTDFVLVNAGRYDGDNKTDFLIYNATTGELQTAIQDGATITSFNSVLNLGPASGWSFHKGKP